MVVCRTRGTPPACRVRISAIASAAMDASLPVMPPRKRLADYAPPDWLVPAARFRFELDSERTLVHARLEVARNGLHDRPLHLDGEELELLAFHIDGVPQPLPSSAASLTLPLPGDSAIIETSVAIRPAANSRLMGLYASGGNLCTQCEAEGFRRITFWPDRPDVLSRISVRLEADRARFPVLLSNGNLKAQGGLDHGRHFAEWDDPFPKPSYLFAVVAGQLSPLRDHFVTRSGREVALAIYVNARDLPRTRHAMTSLKQAMAWDELTYGREYDLESYNIVAVHDFNFGAMENKGLNIFNARYILADSNTATDQDFDAIATVVGHEYFHNWSGNRVTCRDWFQLCLKEGLTVFRDQSFSESLGSAAVRRIESVRMLRASQFPEDDGPLAHPVRPDSYMEISNFYTATVYNKGAELIRMIARILGPQRWRAATDDYFARFDGHAATVEDFLDTMALHGLDAARFRRWYEQPGTPLLDVEVAHDALSRTADIRIMQRNPKAGENAPPLPVPLAFALFADDGRKLAGRERLILTEAEQIFRVEDIERPPVVSLNRSFAAPVNVRASSSRADLALLAAHEDDPFARYEAMQQLMLAALTDSIACGRAVGHDDVLAAVAAALKDWRDDPALVAETILIPGESLIGDQLPKVDPQAVHHAREELRATLRDQLGADMRAIHAECSAAGDSPSVLAKGQRRLRGVSLSLLAAGDDATGIETALQQYHTAATMTDRMNALLALANSARPARDEALAAFHDAYQGMADVMDKWFLVQATSTRPDTLAHVQALLHHPLYDARNPNRLRSVVLGFALNPVRFHADDGSGYAFLADQVLAADRTNPQSAARLLQPLTRWQRMATPWDDHMRAAIARVAAAPDLSKDVTEVVTNSLS